MYATIFEQFMAAFWKGPILNAGPSENVLIVGHPKEDHNEQEFNRLITGEILDQPKKSSTTF